MSDGIERKGIVGMDQLLLAIALYIYPTATSDEICAFIVANGGSVYSLQIILDRCKELELTKKRCSKDFYDYFSESTMRKLRWYQTPPLLVLA